MVEIIIPPAFDEHLFDAVLERQRIVSLSQAGQWSRRLEDARHHTQNEVHASTIATGSISAFPHKIKHL
jgi:hypothetical protein